MRIRTLYVDDSPDLVRLYTMLIGRESDLECAGSLPSADQLVEEVVRTKPDVVILDLTMPGRDPLEAVRELAVVAPAVRVIAFSGHDDDDTIDAVFKAGAWDMVSKNEDPYEVLAAIRRTAAAASRPHLP